MEDRLLKIVEDIKNNVFSELVAETPELMCEEFDKDVSALFACFDDEIIPVSAYECEQVNVYFVMEMFEAVLGACCDEFGIDEADRLLGMVYQRFCKSFSKNSKVFQVVCIELAVCFAYVGDIDWFNLAYEDINTQIIRECLNEFPFFYADKMMQLMNVMRDEKCIEMGKMSLDIYSKIEEITEVDYVCCLENMCDTYMVLNRYKEYKKYADQLKNWVEKLNDDNDKKNTVMLKLWLYESSILVEQGKYANAEQCALQGYGMCEDSEQFSELRLALINNLIVCFCCQEMLEKSIQYLNEGLEIINKYGIQESMGAAVLYNTWNLLSENEFSGEAAQRVMSWLWQSDVEKLPVTMFGMILNSIRLNINNKKIKDKDVAYVERVLNLIGSQLNPEDIDGGILFYWQVKVIFYEYIGDIQRSKSAFDNLYCVSNRYSPDMDAVIEIVFKEYDRIKGIMDRDSLGSLLFSLARRTPFRLEQACDVGDERGLINKVSRVGILFKIIVAAVYRNDISCSDDEFFELVCNMKNVYPDVLRKRKIKYANTPEMKRLNDLHRKLLDLDGVRYYGHQVDDAVGELKYEIHELEKRIYTSQEWTDDSEFAWKSVEDLFLLIPDKTIYIDYVQFTNEQKDVTERNLRYGVVVAIRQGAEVYVRRLDMINAYNIRTVFSSLDLEIRRSRGCGNSSGGMIKWLNKNIQNMLYNQLILPVFKVIELECNIEKIIISGDIELSAFAFDILFDSSGRYLAESYNVNYVNSLRNIKNDLWMNDWIENNVPIGNVEKCMVVGNPQFTIDKNRVLESDRTFGALPLTKVEVQAVADVLETEVIQKQNANKNIFREVHAPILHIATHGEHLMDNTFLEKNRYLLYDMPLRKTCFFMSGANDWIATGKIDSQYGTGLVSAEEICTYDWTGVKLVVLSACFSGSGDISYEEGLLGMNTAFIAQGVQAAIISLWEVDDLASAVLMTRFYKNLKDMSVSEALWRAKKYLMSVTVEELTRDGWFGEQRVRRMGLVADSMRELAHYPKDTRLFSNPVYWAGFVLWL